MTNESTAKTYGMAAIRGMMRLFESFSALVSKTSLRTLLEVSGKPKREWPGCYVPETHDFRMIVFPIGSVSF